MNFTLVYDGDLKANGDVKHKQEVRRVFHYQLHELWKGTPFKSLISPSQSLTTEIGEYCFFPLVSAARDEIAELQIIMLRPEPGAGHIVRQGGDIDNRLKTLFDSLRMPKNTTELPSGDEPEKNEDPFFCLLEDDALITSLSVTTDRLLEPCESSSHVKLIIRVQIKRVPRIGANMVGSHV